MKKLLALVLAMVMTLGLATVGTNAAATRFSDDATIKNTEAAAVTSAIGLFDGDENQNFRPTDTLKRSEAAKLVAYLMLTKKTADSLVGTGTRYSDVTADKWFAGYVEYLTSAGVLGGVGDGKFNPDGEITTVDFAKMLLVALGFDAKIENLVLSDYRINTIKLANEIKLFEGNNDVVATNAITRDEAALYAFNLIKTPIVEYDNTTTVNIPNSGAIVTVGSGKAHKKTTSDVSEKAQNISYKGEEFAKRYVEFGEQYYPDLELVGRDNNWQNTREYTRDDMGRPVRKWAFKKADLGTYAMTNTYLVSQYGKKVTRQTLYDLLGKSTYDNLTAATPRADLDVYFDGQLMYENYSGTAYTDFRDSAPRPTLSVKSYIERNDAGKANGTGDGMITEVYRDNDGNVSIVSYNEYVFQASGDFNSTTNSLRVTATGDTSIHLDNYTLKLEDYEVLKDVKADDYLLITAEANATRTNYKVTDVKKATILTGEVSAYAKTSSGVMDTVTINGEEKGYAVTVPDDGDVKAETFSIGKNATVVLNSNGFIVAVDEAVVVTDYVLIRQWGRGNSTISSKAFADAIFSDGTSAEINVKEAYDYDNVVTSSTTHRITAKSTIQGWGSTSNAYRWYAYSKNSSNEYTLSAVSSNYTWSGARFTASSSDKVEVTDSDNVSFIGRAGVADARTSANKLAYTSVKANDKTVMVLRDVEEDLYVYTGVKNLAKVSLDKGAINSSSVPFDAAVYTVNNKNGFAVAAYVEVNVKATISGSANDSLIYVRDYNKDVYNTDKTWYNYRTFTIEGEASSATADNRIGTSTDKFYVANYASRNKDGNLTNFQMVDLDNLKRGNIVGAKTPTNSFGTITWSSGTITFNGLVADEYGATSRSFTVDKDTKVLLVKRPTANSLFSVSNADYELTPLTGTAKAVADDTKGDAIKYSFVARTTNESGSVLKELYVTFGTDESTKYTEKSAGDYPTTGVNGFISDYNNSATAASYNAENKDISISAATGTDAISGTLAIKNAKDVTFTGNVDVSGTLEIQANGTVDLGTHITGTGTVVVNGKTVYVGGNSLEVKGGTATINAETITINGGLYTTGSGKVYLNGDVEIAQAANSSDRAYINTASGTLYVDGNVTVKSTGALTVDYAKITGSLNVDTPASFTFNNVDVEGLVAGVTSNKIAQLATNIRVALPSDATTAASAATVNSGVEVYSISGDTTGLSIVLKKVGSLGQDLPFATDYYQVNGSKYSWTVYQVSGDASERTITVKAAN